jgi:glycosyltransferase involved in cell wall biosynthesis
MILLGDFSPDPRVEREAKTLSEHGFDVTLLAWNRGGKLAKYEKRGSVVVHRFGPSLPSYFQRLTPIGKFLVKTLVVFMFSLKTVRIALRENAHIIYSHDLDTLHVGVFLRILKSCEHVKIVYDSHENYPATLARDVGSWLGIVSSAVELVLVKFVDGIIASTPFVASRFQKHHKNVVTVMNTVDLNRFDNSSTPALNVKMAGPLVTYVGGVGEGKGLGMLLQAKKLMKCQCTLAIVGAGPYLESLRQTCKREDIEQVVFTGKVMWDEVPGILRQSSIGFCVLEPTVNHSFAVPNKLFEYAAASLPIVVSPLPGLVPFVRDHRCGLVVDCRADKIAMALDALLSNPVLRTELGKNGRASVELAYNWDRQAIDLLKFLEDLFQSNNH